MGMHEVQIPGEGPEGPIFQEWVDQWNLPTKMFSDDGIVDVAQFGFWNPRIVIVLKDVHSSCGFSLRSFLKAGARNEDGYGDGRPTWGVVQRWLVALSNRIGGNLKLGDSNRAVALRTIAALNLKKSPGGSIADNSEVNRHVDTDREFLLRQIRLYCDKPTVFACGGRIVYDALRHLLKDIESSIIRVEGMEFLHFFENAYAFDVGHHPCMSSKSKHDKKFVEAVMAVRSLLKL